MNSDRDTRFGEMLGFFPPNKCCIYFKSYFCIYPASHYQEITPIKFGSIIERSSKDRIGKSLKHVASFRYQS